MRARLSHLAAGRLAAAVAAGGPDAAVACSRAAAGGLLSLLPPIGAAPLPVAAASSSSSSASFSSSATEPTKPILIKPIQKLLVANRGEIACRVLATAKRLNIPTVAVFSDADANSAHVALADEAVRLGPAPARESYLRRDAVLEACHKTGADAVHPGYGFLSESADFSEACAKNGVRFVGPGADAIRRMGDKSQSKIAMERAEPKPVPVVPGYHGQDQSDERLKQAAEETGFPLLVKAVSGGGGKGMKLAETRKEFESALHSARSEALAAFGDDRVLLERYVRRPRHVEVQVMADAHGQAADLFDRDCSVQRRHQKVIEEAPAPGLPRLLHRALGDAAVRAALAVGYVSAGTVEFIVDADAAAKAARIAEEWEREHGGGKTNATPPDDLLPPFFYFMEMNTRLQVEHPVTEAVCGGLDLVELQLRVAEGRRLPTDRLRALKEKGPLGHAFEARLYAESPRRGFLPGAGRVRRWVVPRGATAFGFLEASGGGAAGAATAASSDETTIQRGVVRVDSGVRSGDDVGVFYDPMIAKVVATGADRADALERLNAALRATQVAGLPTNLAFLRRLAEHPAFSAAPGPELAAELDTGFIPRHAGELLAPEPMPRPEAAALAVAARLALGALAARAAPAAASAAARAPAMGAWSAGDSKRLWHYAEREVEMAFPEAAAVVGGEEGEGDEGNGNGGNGGNGAASVLRARARILGSGEFDVTPLPAKGDGSSSAPVEVRGLTLELERRPQAAAAAAAGEKEGGALSARLEATVNGSRVRACVLRYEHVTAASSEAVLTLWPLTPGGDAAAPPQEWRWPLPCFSKVATGGEEEDGEGGGASAAAVAVAGAVRAPMPGRVVRVLVQEEGARVARGDPLLVLEAMKMEHTIKAPRAGVVRWGSGGGGAGASSSSPPRPGQQVADGAVLLRVVAEDEKA